MAIESQRVQLTVRLKADDKDFFTAETEACGIEPSIAARQVLEMLIKRMREGADYVDVLHALKSAMRPGDGAGVEVRPNAA